MAEYIKREDALAELDNACRKYDEDVFLGLSLAANAISKLPAADVRPVVRGEWVKAEVAHQIRKKFQPECCSVCRREKRGNWNFCPNCGADMRGEDNDNL